MVMSDNRWSKLIPAYSLREEPIGAFNFPRGLFWNPERRSKEIASRKRSTTGSARIPFGSTFARRGHESARKSCIPLALAIDPPPPDASETNLKNRAWERSGLTFFRSPMKISGTIARSRVVISFSFGHGTRLSSMREDHRQREGDGRGFFSLTRYAYLGWTSLEWLFAGQR